VYDAALAAKSTITNSVAAIAPNPAVIIVRTVPTHLSFAHLSSCCASDKATVQRLQTVALDALVRQAIADRALRAAVEPIAVDTSVARTEVAPTLVGLLRVCTFTHHTHPIFTHERLSRSTLTAGMNCLRVVTSDALKALTEMARAALGLTLSSALAHHTLAATLCILGTHLPVATFRVVATRAT